ncbi:hypothetical protein JHK82_040377 [Glycine max]|nr:hypothetical protein JHK82_040377 [Glycine max]
MSDSKSTFYLALAVSNIKNHVTIIFKMENVQLLGMVLIMVGLYSFLWDKNNETMRTAQQPIVAAAEISNVTDFPARAESIATIVTSSSRMNSIVLKLEKS